MTELKAHESLVLSGTAAVISKTVSAPLVRVKLLLQNQGELIIHDRLSTPYTGFLNCTHRIIKNEGVLSLWRGNFTNCLRYFPYQAINFTLKEKFKQILFVSKTHNYNSTRNTKANPNDITRGNRTQNSSFASKLIENMTIGGMAGVCSMTVTYPLDYGRTRLSNDIIKVDSRSNSSHSSHSTQDHNRQFKNLRHVLSQTYKFEGLKGIYRGYVITCFTAFIYRAMYFGIYDTFKSHTNLTQVNSDNTKSENKNGNSMQTNHSAWKLYIVGLNVSATASLAVYPLDTIKRRLMMTSGETIQYKGTIDCFRTIVAKEGIGSLYRGCIVNLVRSVAGASTLVIFDVFRDYYVDRKYRQKGIA